MEITSIKTNIGIIKNNEKNWYKTEPEIFELYVNSEQTRQTQQQFSLRHILAQACYNVQSQNHTNTQSYQSNPMKNEIPLPYTTK